MPFSYVNDASDDSNEVCLHITYLFVKALVFVSHVFLLALPSHENLHSLPTVVSSVFSPESTPLVTQQSPRLYSANLFICAFFFICLFISLSLLILFFSNRSLGTFFHRFRIPFPFPDSGFCVLVLPVPSGPKSHTFTVILAVFALQPRWRHKPLKGLFDE